MEPEPTPAELEARAGRAKKDRPTPSRREAEAARRQRVNRTLTKKEARAAASRQARARRMQSIHARENVPEKALMRDYIDARFSLGELLLPSLAVILITSLLGSRFPQVTVIATLGMYLFLLLVLFDATVVMWRGFKKVLAARLPQTPTKGLLLYGMNRCIQIRRFRMPPPRIKRGQAY
ncbi:MAG TPA: DUF3043 domain-containing protein [Propionibacteriaceae bacterium]|nr:DUF3043 domain-containing protein [Propionibacteriaceae bacterium]